jgi:hypothetical protein
VVSLQLRMCVSGTAHMPTGCFGCRVKSTSCNQLHIRLLQRLHIVSAQLCKLQLMTSALPGWRLS